jgi:hypothetical protein
MGKRPSAPSPPATKDWFDNLSLWGISRNRHLPTLYTLLSREEQRFTIHLIKPPILFMLRDGLLSKLGLELASILVNQQVDEIVAQSIEAVGAVHPQYVTRFITDP